MSFGADWHEVFARIANRPAPLSYGIAFTTVAALGGPRWMKVMAWISWILCAVGTSFIGTAELYLFCVVSVLLVAVVPGVLLLRAEPAAES